MNNLNSFVYSVSLLLLLGIFEIHANDADYSTTTLQTEQVYKFYPPQAPGFNDIAKSGPIVLVNKKTLYISNLRYNNRGYRDVHFWAGNGTEPSSEGTLVPDDNDSYENLRSFSGESVYLTLPGDLNTDNIEYFGVWSKDRRKSLGHTFIQGIRSAPEGTSPGTITKEGYIIMRVPKCCPFSSVLTTTGCELSSPTPFIPDLAVFEHNETHINNESLNRQILEFEPFVSPISCSSGKYFLDRETEQFGLLMNGSLIVRGVEKTGIMSQGDYCLESIAEDPTDLLVFVCAPETRINKAMFRAYITLVVLSTVCFAGAFILYCFVLRNRDVHRNCFMGYCASMFVTFFLLVIIQAFHVVDTGCVVLGFMFQFAMICSFTWLAVLCVDILLNVIYFDQNMQEGKRIWWYLAVSIGVPFFAFCISAIRKIPDIPDSFFKPQYGRNECYFQRESQRQVMFYIPICASILVSAVCLGIAKYKIVKADKVHANNYFWIEYGRTFKFMFRQCFFTWVIMVISWISDVVTNSLDDSYGFANAAIVIGALQGVLVAIIFTSHHYTSGTKITENNNREVAAEMTRLPV